MLAIGMTNDGEAEKHQNENLGEKFCKIAFKVNQTLTS